jgi:DNA polymerase III sliding clamp (beta) subunit (PCNA family)
MKLERAKLVESLEKVSPVLGSGDLVPAFKCFQFHGKDILATDGVMVIVTPFKEEVGLHCAVPGVQFLDLLRSLKGKEVILEHQDGKVLVKSSRGAIKGTFSTVEKIDFPTWPKCEMVGSESGFSEFIEGINFCRYSVSKDETTGVLCGVHIGGNRVYGTDRYRIARYDLDKKVFDNPCTIPLKFVSIMVRNKGSIEKIGLKGSEHLIVELKDGTVMYSGLLEGEYRDLNQFFPSADANFTTIEFPEKLSPVLDRHISFLRGVVPTDLVVRVTIEGNKCKMMSVDKELGMLEEDLDLVEEAGKELQFSINPVFWKEVSALCNEFHHTGDSKEGNELILFITDKLMYLCRPETGKEKK